MRAIVIFAGPSAVGKSFTAKALDTMFPDHFTRIRKYTTRPKRDSEDQTSDPIFVSSEEFNHMVQNRDFSVRKHFAGNWYGYHKKDFEPTDKHLIVDVAPFFLPEFLQYKNLLIVGLQAPTDYEALLDERMKTRGDSPAVRQARKPLIERDIRDLEAMRPLINQQGKIFQITDSQTVPTEVIPWIIKRLHL